MSSPDRYALGLVETRGLVAALEAADAMVKAADVRLVRIQKTDPALMTVQVTGETAAVRAAVDAGKAAAERVGSVVSTHIISRPATEMASLLRLYREGPPDRLGSKGAGVPSADALDAMTVRALRSLARTTKGLSISGRAIARAGKADLLAAFAARGR